MFEDIRENDARAVVKGWGFAIARELKLDVDPESRIFRSINDLEKAFTEQETDAVSMTAKEFWLLPNRTNHVSRLLVGIVGETTTEEYLVLVRKDSAFQRISDLRGKTMLLHDHPRMSPATTWYDLALAAEVPAPGSVTEARPTILRERKLTRVVLPVFFRKVEACLVNRKGFETMCEMNPQVQRDLRALASSPPLLPMGFFFRRGYPKADADRMIGAFSRMQATPAGQQVLSVFQCSRVQEESMDVLLATLTLFDEHARLIPSDENPVVGAVPSGGPP
ncbi:MAG: PhnD/SsuA/transferrin family substrate-binding protein [Verrucomicrobiales bacterium]|nr:PhnD/SsuA/transferrin family substrate-binding protein [Verrucomicrobiales bacterium]